MSTVVRRFRPADVSVGDRLTVTLFLAGLFHLIVILGITFAPPVADDSALPTVEVILSGDALPDSARNDDAAYLAERTQQGSGNTRNEGTRRPGAGGAPVDAPGAEAGLPVPAPPPASRGEARLLSGRRGEARLMTDAPEEAVSLPTRPLELLAGEPSPFAGSGLDAELVLRGPERRELSVSPSTQTSEVAVYLDAWRQRVEQLGTLNFPNEARRRHLSGNPTIEVVLAAGGGLVRASVQRSSGHAELDQAAIEILKLATPFEPFPEPLAANYDVLRFAYEWQFVGGRLTGSSIEVPAGELRRE